MHNNNPSGILPTNFSIGCSLRSLSLHENELEGKIPRSLANCIELQVLDLGDNHLNDTFPVWLGNLPYLRVLRLKSNKLHGPIRSSAAEIMFPDLRIIDLSYNAFSKELPECLFQHLKGMRTIDQTMMVPSDDGSGYYEDLVVVVTKGLKLKVKRILSLYTVIDLSSNSFEGHIPSIMGDLIAIRISGDIPQQLASLTFLEFLNLSHNHLRGCIPQGPQLHSFEINSYQGNDGLCGFPVSKGCGNDSVLETNNTKSALDDQESNSESFDDFCKDCASVTCFDQSRVEDVIFLTLSFVKTLWDPNKVIGRIKKKKLLRATIIIRKIIFEGGLVVADDVSGDGVVGGSSGSGAIVGANDAHFAVFETTNHYDYDHTSFTDFLPSSECSACKCQHCKAKHDGVINAIKELSASVKELASKRGFIPSKRISYPYTPLEIKAAKRRRKEISKEASSIKKTKLQLPCLCLALLMS
ncbi:putative protein-tyrosine-phosphatase IBR5-like [Capsicum annuum]|nr:putative protein-tyrosine-phosphatase IBR5-like [Capsicum annuum]